MSEEEQKIIIDEGWKAKVEREREAVAEKSKSAAANEVDEDGAPEELSLFDNLVASLSAQAMMALGLVAPEGQQRVMVDLGMASHLIDTLRMLLEKTAGNVTEDESANLKEAVSELQRVFGVRVQQADEAVMQGSGLSHPDPAPPS